MIFFVVLSRKGGMGLTCMLLSSSQLSPLYASSIPIFIYFCQFSMASNQTEHNVSPHAWSSPLAWHLLIGRFVPNLSKWALRIHSMWCRMCVVEVLEIKVEFNYFDFVPLRAYKSSQLMCGNIYRD